MRRGRRKLVGVIGVVVFAGAVFLVPTLWFKPWSIDHFYARVFADYALKHPMLLTGLGLLDATPFDFYNRDLDNLSVAFQLKEARFLDRQLAILRGYDQSSMARRQKLSRDVLDWFMADQKEANRFMFHDYPVNQLSGIQSDLPDFMMNVHPLTRSKDARNYVTRVSKFGVAFDQVLEGLRLRERKGIVPPRFVIDKVLVEMKGFVGTTPREHPLYTTFAARLDSMRGFDAAARGKLLARLEGEIQNTVYPAYGRLIEYCGHLATVATTDDGVWKLPDGDAYYDHCLRSNTTTDLPADTVHALGLREVVRIQAQMRDLLKARHYPTDPLAATMRGLAREPRFHYPVSDSGRSAIIADYQAIIDDADRRMGFLFNVRPKFGVQVKRIPEFKQATAPGAYYQSPSIGGKRPGVFYANLRDPNETERPGMRTLAYHEAVPGHHFQLTIAQELEGVAFFRRIIPFTAYAEGWALYAERLGLEYGFHRDAFDSLGALQAELFRAVRLVVDTGIHRKRWAREQAIGYMVENTGMPESEVVTEIERYIVDPGQACAYKVGQLKIIELRQRAMDRLGPRFDIRKFHDVVLTNGALPLTILERVVEDWNAAESRGATAEHAG